METKTLIISAVVVAPFVAVTLKAAQPSSKHNGSSEVAAPALSARHQKPALTSRQQGNVTPAEAALLKELGQAFENGSRAQREGNFSLAVQEFKRASQIDPSDSIVMESLAKAYDAAGQWNEARIEYKEVLRPRKGVFYSVWTDARALARYGELCEKVGDGGEAMNAYRAACAGGVFNDREDPIAPRTKDLAGLRAAAFGRAGLRDLSHGNEAAAERELRRAAASDSQNWAVHCHLGQALKLLARYPEADGEFALAQKWGGGSSRLVTLGRSEMSARLGKPKHFSLVNGKIVEGPQPPSDEEALAKLKAEKMPIPTPYQLEQALKGIRMAKVQFANDPVRLKDLENAERNIQAGLDKARNGK